MPNETLPDQPDVATPEEILRTFTQIMRGDLSEETGTPKVSERCRAAELLGKRYGLFAEKEPPPKNKSALARDIEHAMQEMSCYARPPHP